jgi:sarcosine oxidase delta subunit
MEHFSKRLVYLKNAKPGTKLEVWHHPLCGRQYHIVATTKNGEIRQDFPTETRAREMFERMSEEMAVA